MLQETLYRDVVKIKLDKIVSKVGAQKFSLKQYIRKAKPVTCRLNIFQNICPQ